MSLTGYQPETRDIQIGGGESFQVKGLSLVPIAVLVREHFPDLDAIFDLFQSADNLEPEKFQPIALSVISQAPGLAANVIALAAGEGSAQDAERLPLHAQLAALLAIGELTFSEVGSVKKTVETIATLLKNLRNQNPTPSQTA